GEQSDAIVVAGGMGAAPLLYLLRTLRAAGKSVSFFYGARSASELVLRDQYCGLASVYGEATDDGSQGQHGRVTELISEEMLGKKPALYACGPEPMLRAVAQLAQEHHCRCFVSLEAHMACGVGACLGCVVPISSGEYARVCVDGPVFAAEEVFPQ
ncbi:MAG: dihydroorotate dehydrogenase electron transfer subunit, partial [Firmicutes bacterium]|nr:dihydroorotate dehydrogenase electron transfer subunit [Bacillota bacterium]